MLENMLNDLASTKESGRRKHVKCGVILKPNDLLSAFEFMVRKVNDLEEKLVQFDVITVK